MKITLTSTLIVFASVMAVGCSPMITSRYHIHAANVAELRELQQSGGIKLKVRDFSATTENDIRVLCRGLPIAPPDGKTFSVFIKDALVDELRASDMLSDDSNVEIGGTLKNIELHTVSSSGWEGMWRIEAEIWIDNRKPFLISLDRPFASSFGGHVACENAKQAFIPTVQDFINVVVKHPAFQSAVMVRQKKEQRQ